MDAVIKYLPAPSERPPVFAKDENGIKVKRDPISAEKLCGLAFKVWWIWIEKIIILQAIVLRFSLKPTTFYFNPFFILGCQWFLKRSNCVYENIFWLIKC